VQRNVAVRVLVSSTGPRDEALQEGPIPLIKAGQWGRVASAPLNPGFPRLLKDLSRQADIVHFHFPNPTGEISALAVALSNPMVVTYHSDIVRQKRLRLLYQPFMNLFLSRVDHIIATSPDYVRTSPTLKRFRRKSVIIPLGVDLRRFQSETEIDPPEDESPEILFIGRFRYYKGLHILVEAMPRVKRAKLLLVGSGPLEHELRAQVARKKLGEKVIFLGELTHDKLIRRLHRCRVLVLPSVERSEAFGIVLLEAMACGKAVISTELGTGTSYVNQHGKTGLVVPPGNPQALAAALNELLGDPNRCRQMGRAARRRICCNFSADQMVDRTLRVYQDVLNHSHAKATLYDNPLRV
ncbi:MAG: glycosyltransferase, partial [Desulfobacterales bacterium]